MNARSKILAASTLSGIAILGCPLAASALTADTTISSVVSPSLTITTGTTVNLDVTPSSSGVQTTDKDVVSVSTNDINGYTLKLNAKTTATSLVSGGNSILAGSGTPASPAALTAGHWGFRVDSTNGFGAGPTATLASAAIGSLTYAGVPASNGTPATLKTTASTASGDTTNVWYSVAANDTQPTGTYTQQVTYTATTN